MVLSADGRRKLDEAVAAEVLMDADALGAALGAPVEEKEGRRAVRLDAARLAEGLRFAPPERDLRRFDLLAVTLHSDGRTLRPELRVELATRTPGLVHDDSCRTGLSAPTEYATWGEYLFPYENFLIFGLGELLHPVKEMTLALGGDTSGPVWLGELRALRRERARGPRLTDAGLLAELDLDATELADVLVHFKNRTRPLDIYSQLPALPADWSPRTADDICAHFIQGYDVGDPINWRLNPNGYLEWMHAFNRLHWLPELLRAYAATSDAKYVRALDDIWLSWLRANPEPVGHNGGGDPAWETLSTAVRIYGFSLNAWFGLLHDEHLRDATRIEALKSLFGHAEHLLRYQGYANNWLVVESRVLYVLGALFPEFRRADAWRREGEQRLAGELERQVFPDGADWEFAPGYHMMASQGFTEPYEVAQLNGLSLPPLFAERLPKTFEYIAGMTRPDGTLPSVNDSGGYRARGGGNFLQHGARLFARPDLAAAPEGPFAGKSRAFPDSGFHVLASGRDHEARWLLFDGGEPGASHRHDDALNIEVFALGLPFIVDPGITSYLRDDWTSYYRASAAHNTVMVNGAGQCAAGRVRGMETASVRGRVRCAFGAEADFLRGVYEGGYHGLPDGVRHTRSIVFVRGGYWVVFDEVSGDAAREMEARFQFVPLRLTIDGRRRRFRTLRQSRPNLELIVAHPTRGAKLSIACGETRPVGGWVSDGEDMPAPQARIRCARKDASEPLRLVTVIYPFAEGVDSGVTVHEVEGLAPGDTALEIRRGRGKHDTVLYSWRGEPLYVRNIELDAPVALVRVHETLYVSGGGWDSF